MDVSQQPPTPISGVSNQAILKAVNALLKWKSSKSQTQNLKLLPSDEFIYLVLTLNKIPSKNSTNAHKITLPNPLYTADSSEFCLFVHDKISKSAKQKVEEQGIPVSKVIKLSQLKKDFKAFEQKRKLCDSFDLFFSDKRIIPLLPNVIGKQFYSKKKIPVPIALGRNDWKEQIDNVLSSAMLYLSTGTCSVIKVAKSSMNKDEIVENVIAAVNGVAQVVPKKWKNVRAFHLKFSESLALPIYQKVPELGLKISGVVGGSEGNGEEKVVVSAIEEKKPKEKVSKRKGRIQEVRYNDNVGVGGVVGEDESVRRTTMTAMRRR
ncbi:Ribosomal L1 domain-containing protein 1 [Bienertia sinuspersici]